MNEEKVKILGNTEATEEPEAQKVPTTNMMVETLLLEVREGFAAMNRRFDRVEQKVNISNERILDLDAKQ